MFALFPFPTCPFNQAGKDSCRHIWEARPLGGEFLFLCQRSGKLRCREFICPVAAMRCLWQSETGPESLVLVFSPQIILPSSGTVVNPSTALSWRQDLGLVLHWVFEWVFTFPSELLCMKPAVPLLRQSAPSVPLPQNSLKRFSTKQRGHDGADRT